MSRFVSALHTAQGGMCWPCYPVGAQHHAQELTVLVGLSAFSLRHLQARARTHDSVPGAHSHVPVPGRGRPCATHPMEREGQALGSRQAPAQVHSLHSKLQHGTAWCSPDLPNVWVLVGLGFPAWRAHSQLFPCPRAWTFLPPRLFLLLSCSWATALYS